MSLTEYRAKRDFRHTREPAGRVRTPKKPKPLRYVIQKHSASHLHYDFRLEMAGVLKSWAVPKGLPTRRGERHLAIEVEDHPLDYGTFEGTIPSGNYGAGTVMLWDIGTYTASGGDPLKDLESGKLHLTLQGKKLNGEWTLVRLRPRESSPKPQWLVLKSGQDQPHTSPKAAERSALTGRSLQQIADARDNPWSSNRPGSRGRKLTHSDVSAAPDDSISGGESELPRNSPRFLEPMKALLAKELPKGPQWIYEIKFDGVRALAIKDQGRVQLISRANKDLGAKYPNVLQALKNLSAGQAVLDGEIVAVDSRGRSSFQLLQSYQTTGAAKPPLLYYVFDILNLEGRDLKGLPLWRRKELAENLVSGLNPVVRFSAGIKADSSRVMWEMQKRGLEGLVAKKMDSRYEPGRRSGAWIKFKWTLEQEFVIGGFTEPKGGRSHFGAVLVGYYKGDELLFAAKVGTGFNHTTLASLYKLFKPFIRPDCPFANLPEAQGLTRAQMRRCTWLDSRLVCQIRFSEWTRDGHLRQPAFLGMREDKEPQEVVREAAQ